MTTTTFAVVPRYRRGPAPQDAIRLYQEGLSIRQNATRTGSSYTTVHRRLLAAGVTLRSRGARPRT